MTKKYLVTYGAIDARYGNPFWHAYFLLSVMEPGKPIEVVDIWSFYGPRSTTNNQGSLDKLKRTLGMDVDLVGNHGMLVHEKIRYLDRGDGSLHGVTFEITEEKFKYFQDECAIMVAEQDAAIQEVVTLNNLKVDPNYKHRIYPHEKYSRIIYDLEKVKALDEKRSSRLLPFELQCKLTMFGLSASDSFSCKSGVLSLLSKVLTPEQINRLTENGKHPTVTKYSGPMEVFYLYSAGPCAYFAAENIYYRRKEDAGVKLYWTLPPQEIEALDNDTERMVRISQQYVDDVKKVIQKLQCLEWLFINVKIPECYRLIKNKLIERIRTHYQLFSVITDVSKKDTALSDWQRMFHQVFSLPTNKEVVALCDNIKQAESCVNSIYAASLFDKLDLDEGYFPKTIDSSLQDEKRNDSIGNDSALEADITWVHPVDALASHLSEQDKYALWKIVGQGNMLIDNIDYVHKVSKLIFAPKA